MGRRAARRQHLEIISLRAEKQRPHKRILQGKSKPEKKVPASAGRTLSTRKASCTEFSASLWHLAPAVQTGT
jgi:hypothetical protein